MGERAAGNANTVKTQRQRKRKPKKGIHLVIPGHLRERVSKIATGTGRGSVSTRLIGAELKKTLGPRASRGEGSKPEQPTVEVGGTPFVDSLDGLKKQESLLKSQHRKKLREVFTELYRHAEVARENTDAFLELARDARWEKYRARPKVGEEAQAIKHVIRFHVGFDKDPQRQKTLNKKSNHLYQALGPLFEAGVRSADVTEILKKKGGISGLVKLHKNIKADAADMEDEDSPPGSNANALLIHLFEDDQNGQIFPCVDGSIFRLKVEVGTAPSGLRTFQILNVKPITGEV